MKTIITTLLILTLILFLLLSPMVSFAYTTEALPFNKSSNKKNEAHYQNIWCRDIGGVTEYKLNDNTRVDCLTNSHAIEVDFAHKWYEALGQSLYYGMKTDRIPGIALIIKNPMHDKYYSRLIDTITYSDLNIDVWRIKAY